MNIKLTKTEKLDSGKEIKIYTLSNDHNISLTISTYGGIISSIKTPDRNGKVANIALGFENPADYRTEAYKGGPYFGALIGRYANRIQKGKFTLNGQEYKLAVNNGPNHLHGGIIGFNDVIWQDKPFKNDQKAGLILTYLAKDMEEGYPGNLSVKVTYSLNNKNEFSIHYQATTDQATPINLTNHLYFNLNGVNKNILNHRIKLNADYYTPSDDTLIPTGEILSVNNTPFDFRTERELGSQLTSLPQGYDNNYVVAGIPGELKEATLLSDTESGRKIVLFTTQPGIQLYTGYWIPEYNGKFGHYAGVALETQHFPDSPNKPHFPNTILKPGELFDEKTVYKFGVL